MKLFKKLMNMASGAFHREKKFTPILKSEEVEAPSDSAPSPFPSRWIRTGNKYTLSRKTITAIRRAVNKARRKTRLSVS